MPVGEKGGLTFYTRHIDLFGKLFVVLSLYSVIYSLSRFIFEKHRKKKERKEHLAHMFERLVDEY